MESFVAKFIKEYSAILGKHVDFKSSKDVKLYILDLLKKNQDIRSSKINEFYENNFEFICDILFETDYNNKTLQEEKRVIIMNLLSGKRLNINDEKKLISVIDKEVVIIREKIMEIIKYETNDASKNIDPLNEMMFFQLLKNIKK